MSDEFTVDALELKRKLQEQVNREIAGLTPEEQVRWFRERGARAREKAGRPREERSRTP
jgi:hypothetical protein